MTRSCPIQSSKKKLKEREHQELQKNIKKSNIHIKGVQKASRESSEKNI